MGSGSFDVNSYRSYSHSVASKPVDQVFTSRKLDPSLDPKGVLCRESLDSADNPEATPIIVALDVTGSMGIIADRIAKGGLGQLFQGILDRKPVQNPHLMFMGIGDARTDEAPLQVSQFEADNRIVDQLTKIWLEGNGGGITAKATIWPGTSRAGARPTMRWSSAASAGICSPWGMKSRRKGSRWRSCGKCSGITGCRKPAT
jgi:hypothetical protein